LWGTAGPPDHLSNLSISGPMVEQKRPSNGH
jgi:hypothetical protein